MVTLPGEVLALYERFSLYNSPYPAHDRGGAVDLYPGGEAVSPVAGDVVSTRTVACPSRPYAADEDHLLCVDCDDVVARILHVDPWVSVGETVAVGEPLGEPVRSGYFGRWVDEHLHLGFRRPEQDLERATGSIPLALDVAVEPLSWDGRGRVVETGPTHVQLDAPGRRVDGSSDRRGDVVGDGHGREHEGGGDCGDGTFAALASDEGVPLDGGLVHYAGGGVLGPKSTDELSLLGTPIGTVAGRDVSWADVAVVANGQRATGLSLFAARVPFGAKLVFHDGHDLAVGDQVAVSIEPDPDPVRLG